MRRDVRLLGDILGEVIRDSGGPGAAGRRGAAAARGDRRAPDGGDGAADRGRAGDEIVALVASWSLEQAEQVARAFAVYFHLANLAEEHQRIRNLRERDTGQRAGAGVAGRRRGRDQPRRRARAPAPSCSRHCGCTWCSPLTPPRRAGARWWPRCAGSAGCSTCWTTSAPRRPTTPRRGASCASRSTCCGGRRSCGSRRWTPIDEVRTVMTAFDETLFRVVPAVYRELDAGRWPRHGGGAGRRRRRPSCAFGSWVGADRDGNPFVTAQVTRETATIQADHVLRALENATTRIGRALTLHAATTPPSAGLRRALAAAHAAHPELLAEIEARSPQEPYRTYLLFAAQRINATRVRHADLAYPGPAEFLADLRTVQESLAAAGRRPAGSRRAAAPDLAGGDVRLPPGRPGGQAAQRGARPGAGRTPPGRPARLRAQRGCPAPSPRRRCPRRPRRCWPRSARWPGCRTGTAWTRAAATWSASPARPPTSPPCTSWPATPSAGGRAARARRGAAVRERGRPGQRARRADRHARAARGRGAAGGQRPASSRSCSATPTRPRSSARPAPPCGCSTPRPGWPPGPRPTTSG